MIFYISWGMGGAFDMNTAGGQADTEYNNTT